MAGEPLGPVQVAEGFYSQFAEEFLRHYGADSVFVRAAADLFSRALERLLEAQGLLVAGTHAPRLGSEAAREALADLQNCLPDRDPRLLQEACGVQPLGTFGQAIDDQLGAGAFARWLAEWEPNHAR